MHWSRSDEKRKEFYWERADIPEERDLALLRPGSLPKTARFETVADAVSNSERLETSLLHNVPVRGGRRHNQFAEVLKDCRKGYYTCGKPFCPLCARLFRRWLFSEIAPIADASGSTGEVVNVFFEARDAGDLASAKPHVFKDRLRQQMHRSGFSDAIAIGGLEAGFKKHRWILHGHVAVFGAAPSAMAEFRRFHEDVHDVSVPLVTQPLVDPIEQQSYLLKFHTYTRIGRKPVPLKPAAVEELVSWQDAYDFEDFLFLRGLRRRGAELRADNAYLTTRLRDYNTARSNQAELQHERNQAPSRVLPESRAKQRFGRGNRPEDAVFTQNVGNSRGQSPSSSQPENADRHVVTTEKSKMPVGSRDTPHTKSISILEVGVSALHEAFVKLGLTLPSGEVREAVVRIDNLVDREAKKAFIQQLNQLGAHLISPKAQTELVNRIQHEGQREPTFQVATQVGWHSNAFVRPDRVIGEPGQPLEVYLGATKPELTSKYQVNGDLDAWKEIPKLARGNSHLLASLALAFVGPIGDILRVPQVAIQLCGKGGSGKTPVAIAAGSVWGLHPDRQRALSTGFGETWKNTINNLEPIAVAHNHTFLILDETRVGTKSRGGSLVETLTEAAMRLERSVEKGRLTDTESPRSWWVPILSTSNKSLDEMATKGEEIDDAYRDRLIDVPLPTATDGIYQNLHDYKDKARFSKALIDIALEHHGVASLHFLEKLTEWRARDEKSLRAKLARSLRMYRRKANALPNRGRDLTRIHGKFATVYAAGALASKFGLLPPRRELRDALLTCERLHIDHVSGFLKPTDVPRVESMVEVLRAYIQSNKGQFIDLRRGLPDSEPEMAEGPGYINVHTGGLEYLFTDELLGRVVGKDNVQSLKRELKDSSLLVITRAGGQGVRFVAKRKLVNGRDRQSVTAVRAEILAP
jgi:hypothetical protein